VLAGAAGLGVGCGSNSLSGSYSVGNVSQLQVGQLQAVSGEPLAIGRDAAGVWAMTLVCPHAGCDSSVSGQSVFCACHGSTFDAQGNRTGGPAHTGLQHYQVTIDSAGAMTVNADAPVSATTRTPVG